MPTSLAPFSDTLERFGLYELHNVLMDQAGKDFQFIELRSSFHLNLWKDYFINDISSIKT